MQKTNNGLDFEFLIFSFLEERGYNVFDTPATHDFGADIILYYEGRCIAIQCKEHARPIGISAVQEIVAALPYYKADVGVVVSNQTYTREARKLAAAAGVILVDGEELEETLNDNEGRIPFLEPLKENACKEDSPVRKPGLFTRLKRIFA